MSTLSYDQIKQLWIQNGGNPNAAPIMAAIALAESGGRTEAHNPKPPDDSYGLWQINYYGRLGPSRTASYGSPQDLIADPNRQAKAAIAISGNGSNFSPWSTFTKGTYKPFLTSHDPLAAPLPSTPALPSLSSSAAAPGAAVVSSEGDLFKWHIPTTSSDIRLQRATARKIVGGAIMVGGVGLGLAGVFILTGSRVKLPGPAGMAQQAIGIRTERRARAASSSIAATTPDELAERRAARAKSQRDRSAAADYGSARAAGEAAADQAGPF